MAVPMKNGGMSKIKVMFKEIIPNIMTPIIVSATAVIPGYILSEASLSFLGVGVADSIPTYRRTGAGAAGRPPHDPCQPHPQDAGGLPR